MKIRKVALLTGAGMLAGFLAILMTGCGSSSKFGDYNPETLELFPKSSIFEANDLYHVRTNLPPVDNKYLKYEWYVNDSLVEMTGSQYDNAGENAFVVGQWQYDPGQYNVKCKAGGKEATAVFYVTPCITGRKYINVSYNGSQVDYWYGFCELQYMGNETSDGTFPAGTVWFSWLSYVTGYTYTVMDLKVDLANVYRMTGRGFDITFTNLYGYDFYGTLTSGGDTIYLSTPSSAGSQESAEAGDDSVFKGEKRTMKEYWSDLKKKGAI